jgi:hypothetical protein
MVVALPLSGASGPPSPFPQSRLTKGTNPTNASHWNFLICLAIVRLTRALAERMRMA